MGQRKRRAACESARVYWTSVARRASATARWAGEDSEAGPQVCHSKWPSPGRALPPSTGPIDACTTLSLENTLHRAVCGAGFQLPLHVCGQLDVQPFKLGLAVSPGPDGGGGGGQPSAN
jgi:hypothetical protein